MLGKVFKATGGSVKLTKNGKALQFVFEVVRREDDWEKKLVDKMKMYQDFYDNFVPGDSGFASMPQLILICEDEKHMAETFKTIVVNNVGIKQIKLTAGPEKIIKKFCFSLRDCLFGSKIFISKAEILIFSGKKPSFIIISKCPSS